LRREPPSDVVRAGTVGLMTRVHAFGDDALGDLDAVGLAAALRAGDVSQAELVEAAIARAEAVNPALNALAYPAFDRARAAAPRNGFFGGVPTFVKDNPAEPAPPASPASPA